MRIVIFHGRLSLLSGGEVNTRDWAIGLHGRGHRVVIYTPIPGPLAEQIRTRGIAVVDDPSLIADTPDVIFGAGVNDVVALIARFPDVPAVQVCQMWDHWNAMPCPLPEVVLHVAVSELTAEQLVNEHGLPRDRIRIVHNAVDTSGLPAQQRVLPKKPRRALVVVKEGSPTTPVIAAALASRDIAVDFAGYSVGRPYQDALSTMAGYDLVVASGRSAIEAAVAGAAVICADQRGVAGLLTAANVEKFRANNFALALLTQPVDRESIVTAIDAYDAEDAMLVSRQLRQAASLTTQLEQLETIFAEAISRFKSERPNPEDSRKALSAYLGRYLPRPAAGDLSPRHSRYQPPPAAEQQIIALDERVSAVAGQVGALKDELAADRNINRQALVTMQSQRDEVLASTSWRVTQPLRLVIDRLRRLRS